MKICSNCMTQNIDAAKYCKECGSSALYDPDAAEKERKAEEESKTAKIRDERKGHLAAIILAGIAYAFLGAALVFGYGTLHKITFILGSVIYWATIIAIIIYFIREYTSEEYLKGKEFANKSVKPFVIALSASLLLLVIVSYIGKFRVDLEHKKIEQHKNECRLDDDKCQYLLRNYSDKLDYEEKRDIYGTSCLEHKNLRSCDIYIYRNGNSVEARKIICDADDYTKQCAEFGYEYLNNSNLIEARYFFDKVCNSENKTACNDIILKLLKNEHYDEAARLLQVHCDAKNARACYLLGYAYKKSNEERFEKYYDMACNMGESGACKELGLAYYDGDGVKKSETKALKYLEKAYEIGGYSDIRFRIGWLYSYSKGVKHDYAKAKRYYSEDCENGNASSCRNLGYLYRDGKIGRDYKKAFEYFKKACDKDEEWGCVSLAIAYQFGQGVRRDYHEAVKIYNKYCDKDNSTACFGLANLTYEGLGTPKNFFKAKELWKKSCELGEETACQNYKNVRW